MPPQHAFPLGAELRDGGCERVFSSSVCSQGAVGDQPDP
jgi:hypothetical protein